jgi:hypothetical protein
VLREAVGGGGGFPGGVRGGGGVGGGGRRSGGSGNGSGRRFGKRERERRMSRAGCPPAHKAIIPVGGRQGRRELT